MTFLLSTKKNNIFSLFLILIGLCCINLCGSITKILERTQTPSSRLRQDPGGQVTKVSPYVKTPVDKSADQKKLPESSSGKKPTTKATNIPRPTEIKNSQPSNVPTEKKTSTEITEKKPDEPEKKPTIWTFLKQGGMEYLSKKHNLEQKVLYEIKKEDLPSELQSLEFLPEKYEFTQRKILGWAMTLLLPQVSTLLFPQLAVIPYATTFAMHGAHGIGYQLTGQYVLGNRYITKPYAYLTEKLQKTPILKTLLYGKPHWLFKYPVALPRWFIKSSVQGSIQGSLYSSILHAPTSILRSIRGQKNDKKQTEVKKTTDKTTESVEGAPKESPEVSDAAPQ